MGVEMDDRTLEINDDDRAQLDARSTGSPSIPRASILYHGNPDRIGDITEPNLFLAGEWILFGRLQPDFIVPSEEDALPNPISDPYLSRKQCAIRWVPRRSCFEVRTSDKAQRSMYAVEIPAPGCPPEMRPLDKAEYLPPGTLIAIGKRVLLLLSLEPDQPAEKTRMGMVGESPELWRMRTDIAAAALFERPVLVLGETGVGKELVARALHENSNRASGPFVPINCAALPSHLVESLLFGHKKGAFTGATSDSDGLLKSANKGTLFLDELGELPMELQAKLLRVLQERVYTPVGGRKNLKTDARVVAATNRNPSQEMQEGRLRSDLYFRLAAHTIHAPSLQRRNWDVPRLFVHFLRETREKIPQLSWLWPNPLPAHLPIPLEFFVRLLYYRWPGNIRELQNTVEQTARLNLTEGPFQEPELLQSPDQDLPEPVAQTPPRPRTVPTAENLPRPLLNKAARKFGLKLKTLQRLLPHEVPAEICEGKPGDEAVLILGEQLAATLFALLEDNDFNQVQVAETLGVARSTLIRLMENFGIKRPQDLTLDEIRAAHTQARGDLVTMSRLLRVSSSGLKLRLTREKLYDLLH